MRRLIPAAITLTATSPAVADPGHFAVAGGHDHWIALAALVGAAIIAAAALLKPREDEDEDAEAKPESADETGAEEQAA